MKRINTVSMTVELSKIRPNPVQPKDRITESATKALRDHILETGFVAPLIVMARRGGGYTLLDGHRRYAVLVSLEENSAECIVVPSSGLSAEVWFVNLNGGIRNVTGKNWFYVWAMSADPDETFVSLTSTLKKQIKEMVNIFGEERTREIGRDGRMAPLRATLIKTLIDRLTYYDLVRNITPQQRRRIGEWVLKHNAEQAINMGLHRNPSVTRPLVEKFHKAIQLDLPAPSVGRRAVKPIRVRKPQ